MTIAEIFMFPEKLRLSGVSGSSDNTFSAKLDNAGTVKWKKYLESSNSGSSVRIDENGQLLMLNHNCFIINILNPVDGSAAGIIRTFDACDAKNTDAFGQDFDINYDGNLIMAGSKGGGFYLGYEISCLANSVTNKIISTNLIFSGRSIIFAA